MKKVFIQLHKISGIALCLIFTIWFFSGIMLIFTGFPRFKKAEAFDRLQTFTPASIKDIAFPENLPQGGLTIEMRNNKAVYIINKKSGKTIYDAHALDSLAKPTREACIATAQQLVNAPILKIEERADVDIWTPRKSYISLLPFYKVYFNDRNKTQVYVSVQNGEIIQKTTRATRISAYLGAIPHYAIFNYLSIKHPVWKSVLIALIITGFIVSLSGIIVGFVRMRRGKGFKGITPFKNPWYKWHHLAGIFFGIFALTFTISAYVLQEGVPQWIAKDKVKIDYAKKWEGKKIKRHAYETSFPALLRYVSHLNGVKQIEFSSLFGKPCYAIYSNSYAEKSVVLCESDSVRLLKAIPTEEIIKYAHAVFDSIGIKSISSQNKHDLYYTYTQMGSHPLPVYRVELQDANRSVVFIAPLTGEITYILDNENRAQSWLFSALHTFNIGWLNRHATIRQILLCMVCLAGIIISVSGIVLSAKWIARKRKKFCRKKASEN